ncbi:hypothetical protein AB0F73_08425, partial [Micromonospora purpureochromogenes]|uniref:hypothetical protein n=1 Tax=Micromonospora purpureochromogenes TaxID=47872 RepID=UPI003401ECEC
MLVIHGLWLVGVGLAVWAEDSAAPARAPRRPGPAPRQRAHTYAAAHATNAAALCDLPAEAGSLPLTLPT